jgi:hypothetical protein
VEQAVFLPHLYALVTQTIRGEVAVVDTSAYSGGVLDENPEEPGANFLKVGAEPTGIASTPGSVATFVGVGEIGRPGLFAIPSSQIRPAASFGYPDTCIGGGGDAGPHPVPRLTSWPACALRSAPGDVLLIDDPADPVTQFQRDSCDSSYEVRPATADPVKESLLVKENRPFRPKLVVSFPDLGGIAVFDAQELLNRPAGSFDACKLERWVPLKVDLDGLADLPVPPSGSACSNAQPGVPMLHQPGAPHCVDAGTDAGPCSYVARPAGLSYADGKLYIGDIGAPLIHVVDMHGPDGRPTPCNPVEQAPLLPTSVDNPARVVFVKKVAAANEVTPDFKRYLFASDVDDASAMVFDVGANSTTRRPLQRAHPEYNPFQPRDRVKFAAPPADIIVVERDVPFIDPVSGVAPGGVPCNPDPNAVSCTTTAHNCDLGTGYRTTPDYTQGAAPAKLRGEFAFAALTNGKVAVIDIADFDAPCRGPVTGATLAGCAADTTGQLVTSAEVSCNVVSRFEARSSTYMGVGTGPGNHVPGIQTFPLLYNADGSVFSETDQVIPPRMVATLPASIPAACKQKCDPNQCGTTCDTLPGCPLQTFIGGVQTPLDVEGGQCTTACGANGAACTQDSDCCGHACLSTGVCAPAKNCNTTGKGCTPDGGMTPDCNEQNCEKFFGPTLPKPFTPGGIGQSNALAMNLEDPRAHVTDQSWTVTFEGALPGFEQRIGYLKLQDTTKATFADPFGRFCDSGVLGKNAVDWMVARQPKPGLPSDLADYVQITSDLPSSVDPYWSQGMPRPGMQLAAPQVCTDPSNPLTCECADPTKADVCSCSDPKNPSFTSCVCTNPKTCRTCDYATCLDAFGSIDVPTLDPRRDLRIVEAYQDHVEVVPRNGQDLRLLKCCFPTALTFAVRAGNQWTVVGDQVLFLHHVIASDTDTCTAPEKPCLGACRNACDPTLARRNGRLVETAPALDPVPIPDRLPGTIDPSASFLNPMFRFGVFTGTKKCMVDSDCPGKNACDQGICASKVGIANETCTPDMNCHPGERCDNLQCSQDTDCAAFDPSTKSNGCTRSMCTQASDCSQGTCDANHQCTLGKCAPRCFSFGAPVTQPTPRDSVFKFSTNGSFSPLLVGLSTDGTTLVNPQSITFLSPTGELAVTDGAFSGLILVGLTTPGVTRSFF